MMKMPLEERQAFLYDLNPLIQELGLLDSNSNNNNTNNGSGNKNANDIDRMNRFIIMLVIIII